jgi:hypothetical protein
MLPVSPSAWEVGGARRHKVKERISFDVPCPHVHAATRVH